MKTIFSFVLLNIVLQSCGEQIKNNYDSNPTTFQEALDSTCNTYNIPGIAAAVINSKGVEHIGVSGIRKLGEKDSIEISDLFHIGSCTKTFTGLLVATFIEEGRLKWDTKLTEIFPEFNNEIIDDYENVTIQKLLSHSAGLISLTKDEEIKTVPEFKGTTIIGKRKEFTKWILNQPPLSKKSYSNGGFVVVASILEKIEGKSWEELIQERICKPLNIHAKFGFPASDNHNQPWGHWIINRKLSPQHPDDKNDEFIKKLDIFSPAGNISISVKDYSEFMSQWLLGLKGNNGILHSSTFIKMGSKISNNFAIAWQYEEGNGISGLSHFGNIGSFYCGSIIIEKYDIAVIVMTNSFSQQTRKGVMDLLIKLRNKYKKVNKRNE